jgi:hypothetical protein
MYHGVAEQVDNYFVLYPIYTFPPFSSEKISFPHGGTPPKISLFIFPFICGKYTVGIRFPLIYVEIIEFVSDFYFNYKIFTRYLIPFFTIFS